MIDSYHSARKQPFLFCGEHMRAPMGNHSFEPLYEYRQSRAFDEPMPGSGSEVVDCIGQSIARRSSHKDGCGDA